MREIFNRESWTSNDRRNNNFMTTSTDYHEDIISDRGPLHHLSGPLRVAEFILK